MTATTSKKEEKADIERKLKKLKIDVEWSNNTPISMTLNH